VAHTHAGPDRTGRDAVARLDHEAGNLRALEANRIAPLLLRRSGDNYLRLSMDLSTGSAGILAALTAAEHASTIPCAGLILFGPGAVLATIAATCNLFTTGTGRERYEGSLRAAGTPRSMSRTAGLLEAAIYAMTALILSVLVSSFASLMIGMPVALTGGGFHFVVNVWVIALTVLIGFIPLAVSIRLPAVAASRKSLGTVLAPR